MIVYFNIKDEKQRETILSCLNVMNVDYKVTTKEAANELLGADPAFLLACKIVRQSLIEFKKTNPKSIVKPMDKDKEHEFVYKATKIVLDSNNLINYIGVKNCVIDTLMNEGYLV